MALGTAGYSPELQRAAHLPSQQLWLGKGFRMLLANRPQHPVWRAGASDGAAQQAPDSEVPQQRTMKKNQMSQVSHAVGATGQVLHH